MKAFPKIFPVGSDYIQNLFKGDVEITEKIDGSQFDFGCDENNQIVMRSKGKEMYFESYEKLFNKAVDFVADKQGLILKYPGTYFYCEYLQKPKHNILCYERVPENNLILFGVRIEGNGYISKYNQLEKWGRILGLETVPILYHGKVNSYEELSKYLETPSCLGKETVEGIVIKNYNETVLIGGNLYPVFGKYVRESFKEKHNKEWTTGKDRVQMFIDSFRTEARWDKVIQHLKEKGELVNEPKDIGILLKEIERDLLEEEELNIKNGLYKLFKDQILRKARAGFPEYYKAKLLEKSFEAKNES
jgi:hypothetical protein